MAEQVAKNPKPFAGFCVLSMHDAHQAAEELRRCVTELGLKGAILNDFQSAGPEGEAMLMYDQPEYDPFWAAVQVCTLVQDHFFRRIVSIPLDRAECFF